VWLGIFFAFNFIFFSSNFTVDLAAFVVCSGPCLLCMKYYRIIKANLFLSVFQLTIYRIYPLFSIGPIKS
jgi:hypothetical protein